MLAKTTALAGALALAFVLLIAAAAAGTLALIIGKPAGIEGAPTLRLGGASSRVMCSVEGGIHTRDLDLNPQQASNAAVIHQVAADQGLQPRARAAVIALAAALQESSLANLDHGDRDSLGLFQQRPSQGWGTATQIMNPAYAAIQFYSHLQRVPHWWSLPVWQAAQAVQNSAYPTAYQQWQQEAETLEQFLATDPTACKLT